MECGGPWRLLFGHQCSGEPHQSAECWDGEEEATSEFRGTNSSQNLAAIQKFEAEGDRTESIPSTGSLRLLLVSRLYVSMNGNKKIQVQ